MRRFTIETTRCVDARVTIAVGSTKRAGDFFLSYLHRFYVIHKRSELLFWTISSVYSLEVCSTLSTSRFSAAIIIFTFQMGAKLSKGRSNPCGCFPRLRKKTKVVPMSSLDVAQRGVTPSIGPLSLPALLRPANPAVRLGWKSDLVLEDVDIEEETGRIARPILPLPPVIPPPWMRAPALQMTTPAATPAQQEMPAQADLPGFIQDTIEEVEV